MCCNGYLSFLENLPCYFVKTDVVLLPILKGMHHQDKPEEDTSSREHAIELL